MFRIAHISDIHLRADDENKHLKKFISLLNDINKKKCDHLIISGDLSDTSSISDFDIINSILTKFNYFSYDKLTVTIGNHDVYGGAQKGNDVFLFPTKCKNTDYKKKENIFNDKFVFDSKIDSRSGYPYINILNNNLALVSINSVALWSEVKNPIGSNGYCDLIQLKKLDKILNSNNLKNLVKFAVVHHHFKDPELNKLMDSHALWLYSERNTMKFHNKDRLLKLFDKYNINFILHGHTHKTESYNLSGKTFLNSSGCIMPFTDDKKLQYYILNVPDNLRHSGQISYKKITL